MSGIFGVINTNNCISDLYYGIDYRSHLGTEYGGVAFIDEHGRPVKKIHDISNSQFKSKFYEGSGKIKSNIGIGVISDKDAQPLSFESKRDDVEVDFVAGVPDSGTAHAVGYAMESGKPFRRVLFKNG